MIESITTEKLENAIKLYEHANVIVNTGLLHVYLETNRIQNGICQLMGVSSIEGFMKQLSEYIEEICIKLDIPFTYTWFSPFM